MRRYSLDQYGPTEHQEFLHVKQRIVNQLAPSCKDSAYDNKEEHVAMAGEASKRTADSVGSMPDPRTLPPHLGRFLNMPHENASMQFLLEAEGMLHNVPSMYSGPHTGYVWEKWEQLQAFQRENPTDDCGLDTCQLWRDILGPVIAQEHKREFDQWWDPSPLQIRIVFKVTLYLDRDHDMKVCQMGQTVVLTKTHEGKELVIDPCVDSNHYYWCTCYFDSIARFKHFCKDCDVWGCMRGSPSFSQPLWIRFLQVNCAALDEEGDTVKGLKRFMDIHLSMRTHIDDINNGETVLANPDYYVKGAEAMGFKLHVETHKDDDPNIGLMEGGDFSIARYVTKAEAERLISAIDTELCLDREPQTDDEDQGRPTRVRMKTQRFSEMVEQGQTYIKVEDEDDASTVYYDSESEQEEDDLITGTYLAVIKKHFGKLPRCIVRLVLSFHLWNPWAKCYPNMWRCRVRSLMSPFTGIEHETDTMETDDLYLKTLDEETGWAERWRSKTAVVHPGDFQALTDTWGFNRNGHAVKMHTDGIIPLIVSYISGYIFSNDVYKPNTSARWYRIEPNYTTWEARMFLEGVCGLRWFANVHMNEVFADFMLPDLSIYFPPGYSDNEVDDHVYCPYPNLVRNKQECYLDDFRTHHYDIVRVVDLARNVPAFELRCALTSEPFKDRFGQLVRDIPCPRMVWDGMQIKTLMTEDGKPWTYYPYGKHADYPSDPFPPHKPSRTLPCVEITYQ